MAATPEQIQRLRRLLADRVTANEDDSDTFWSDDELSALFDEYSGSMLRVALEGWREKAAEYSRLVDRRESGSETPLSQKFRQAKSMVDYYEKIWKDSGGGTINRALVIAKVASLDESCDDEGVAVPEEIYSVSGENVRYYPLKRFPSILR